MEKAALYIRVSTEEQARGGVSLQGQEEKLLQYCQLQGLEPVKVIREAGISGSKHLKTRPGGRELLQLLDSGQANQVIALKLDRLFRDAADALIETKAWDNAGVTLHLVDMGGQAINTASAIGRFFLNTMAGFAELERNLISERTEAALAYKKAHREAYSPTPYGYDREGNNLKENNLELKAVQVIINLRKQGRSMAKIVEELTAQNIPTKNGGKWYASTVSYILKNQLYEEVA